MIEQLPIQMIYAVHGILGAVVYIFIYKLWEPNSGGLGEITRRITLGAIAGYVVLLMGLPNSLTAMGLGYISVDAFEALLKKFAPKTE